VALYKRGKTWWTDFSVNGVRYRESLDTSDWRGHSPREGIHYARLVDPRRLRARQTSWSK